MGHYNLPWAGRLGRVADCCIFCGESGFRFQASSFAGCLNCPNRGGKPIPELVKKFRDKGKRLAKQWCLARGIDYEATIKNYEEYLGPQGNSTKRNCGNYIVYSDASKQMTDEKFLAKKEEILILLRHLTNSDFWLNREYWDWYDWSDVEKKAVSILED